MLKSTAGGGGIGMSLCRDAGQLAAAFETVARLGAANFANAGVFIEKYVEHARHIEVQIFGDGRGDVIALGERDCSVQRRNQKVIEETPAPDLTDAERAGLHAGAVRLAKAVDYASAGTVEFVFDAEARRFYFLEVNTRLQVEHGVTEEVTGVDLVEWMILEAEGDLPPLAALAANALPRGASIQVRLYAEDPNKQFQPSAGLLTHVEFPAGARVESWVEAGTEVSAHYDPLLAKLIVAGDTREAALAKLREALARTTLYGIETNLDYLRADRRLGHVRARRADHRLPVALRVRAAYRRRARRRRADHRAADAGPPRLLGHRRAALGPDGRPRASTWPTACSATPPRRPGSNSRWSARRCASTARRCSCSAAPRSRPPSTASRCRPGRSGAPRPAPCSSSAA